MRVLVIVPAYNEEECIFNVIASIKKYHKNIEILVINDGSTDNTSYKAREAGAEIIELEKNLGIGGAVQTGFIYANNEGYDVAIQLDGDGQHDPRDLNRLLVPILENSADIVIGSRFLQSNGYKAGFMRSLGISYFEKLVHMLCRKCYYDTTSGYRAINRRGMELFAAYYPCDYPEVEAIVYALKNDLKVIEVETLMKKRQGGKSSISFLKGAYYMLKVTLSLILQPIREKGLY